MLDSVKKIYILGIKGVAMAGIAVILKKMGKQVIGSDSPDIFITDELLKKHQIKVLYGFDESNLPGNTDLVIYSAAHNGIQNPLAQVALKKQMKLISQAELIGQMMTRFQKNVVVVGCHGKTTTSSLLAYALKKLGVNPSYLVGTPSFNHLDGADYREENYFVVEGDEYAVNPPQDKTTKLNFLQPDFIIATNIDYDHPDVYRNIEEVKETFLNFFKKLSDKSLDKKRLIYCRDDKNTIDVIKALSRDLTYSYCYSDDADLRISRPQTNEDNTVFNLKTKAQDLGQFKINLYGTKNVSNATGVAAFLLDQGFDVDKIKKSLIGFTGAKRRFEQIYNKTDTYLFDDYAHHPEEIKACIESVRMRFPAKRLILIFQPHTYSRTNAMKHEFVQALTDADYAFIMPIFPSAREIKGSFKISSYSLEGIAKDKNIMTVKTCRDKEDLIMNLSQMIRPGDTIMTMGAGDVYKFKNDIIKVINRLK